MNEEERNVKIMFVNQVMQEPHIASLLSDETLEKEELQTKLADLASQAAGIKG